MALLRLDQCQTYWAPAQLDGAQGRQKLPGSYSRVRGVAKDKAENRALKKQLRKVGEIFEMINFFDLNKPNPER